ncbi:MAG: glycosyltransferase family 39 protein [Candidatus Andersenbacteria bacterium]|nr:glycosyltransferase family 39 protein [Candidatus Andersenbacteria bacterium]
MNTKLREYFHSEDGQAWQLIVFTTFSVLLIGCLAIIFSNPSHTFPGFFSPWPAWWVQWDGLHYIDIALHGYQTAPDKRFLISFYPLYPLAIRLLTSVIGNVQTAAWLIANVSSLIGFFLFYKLARLDVGRQSATRALLALMLFPTAYFFHLPYTEGLFLVCVMGAFYAVRKGRWDWAGLFGLGASLTRNQGVILFPALLVEWWLARKKTGQALWKEFAYLCLILLGFGIYLWLNWHTFGSPFEFLRILPTAWGKAVDWPWVGLQRAWHIFARAGISHVTLTTGLFEFLASLGFMVACAWSYMRLRLSYTVYMFLTAFLAVALSFYLSTPRYMLSSFPLFLLIGIGVKNWKMGLALMMVSVAFLTIYMSRFLSGAWAF